MEIEIFEDVVIERDATQPESKSEHCHFLAATTIIGDEVRNYAGESLGKIEDLVIDLKSGRIAYAVLSFGGFLGVGNKFFAVPIQVLQMNRQNKFFTLNVDKQLLKRAPGFDKSNWPDFTDEDWQAQISVYYGVSQSFQEPPRH